VFSPRSEMLRVCDFSCPVYNAKLYLRIDTRHHEIRQGKECKTSKTSLYL